MPSFKTFEEIEAWQKARALTGDIDASSNDGAFAVDCGLCDQIRRASGSVMTSIAEGHERGGAGEFVQFLRVAQGSVGKVDSHLCVALDLGYFDQSTFVRLPSTTSETARLIGAPMQYLRNSGSKGGKYN